MDKKPINQQIVADENWTVRYIGYVPGMIRKNIFIFQKFQAFRCQ